MKEVLSVFRFGIWALFFVVFFSALNPDTIAVVAGSIKPEYCNSEGSPMRQCSSAVACGATEAFLKGM
jgi:hypothetical protein